MEPFLIIAVIGYLLSCACYFGYLFFQKTALQRFAMGLMLAAFVLHTASLVACGIPDRKFSGQQSSRNPVGHRMGHYRCFSRIFIHL